MASKNDNMETSLVTTGATLVIAVGTAIAMLHILAVRVLTEIKIHELKAQTARLRAEYAERLARMRARMDDQVEVMLSGKEQDQPT